MFTLNCLALLDRLQKFLAGICVLFVVDIGSVVNYSLQLECLLTFESHSMSNFFLVLKLLLAKYLVFILFFGFEQVSSFCLLLRTVFIQESDGQTSYHSLDCHELVEWHDILFSTGYRSEWSTLLFASVGQYSLLLQCKLGR